MTNDPSFSPENQAPGQPPQGGQSASMPPVTPPPQASSQQPEVAGDSIDEQNPFFVQEDLPPFLDDGQAGWSAGFAVPFQLSEPVAVLRGGTAYAPGANGGTGAQLPQPSAAPQPAASRRRTWMKIGLISLVIVLALGFLGFSMFAQASPPLTTTSPNQNGPSGTHAVPTVRPTPNPKPTPKVPSPTPTTTAGNWVPASLPAGWTNAGLTLGDAMFAERTAATFTDREMSLDYRNIGSRAQHSGTMTAATFILTPAARERFQENDVRVANNQLYDSVATSHLIQSVVNAQPHLIAFQVRGQQQFAWVDVAFTLWQSKLDPQNANHTVEGMEVDPATGQPRVHHMVVLLLRVPPANQGVDAPMGGTGWLVSNYALDQPGGALPDIVQPA